MISREDFYKFLLDYKANYSGTGEYFHKHPQSDSQRVVSEYKKLMDETGYRMIGGRSNNPFSVDLYGRPDLDFRQHITHGQVSERKFLISVLKCNGNNDDSDYMLESDPLFEKFVQIMVGEHNYTQMVYEPYHTITAAGITLSIAEIHSAFNEYAVPSRLNKYVIGDLHVPFNSSDHEFSISDRYSENFCDLVESIFDDIKPYFNTQFVPPDGLQRYSWDDLASTDLNDFTVLDAACLSATRIPVGFETEIEKHKIIIDNLLRINNHGASILVIRALTMQRVSITYENVPKFKDFVLSLSTIMREIRMMM
jgi:hypothetical protein